MMVRHPVLPQRDRAAQLTETGRAHALLPGFPASSLRQRASVSAPGLALSLELAGAPPAAASCGAGPDLRPIMPESRASRMAAFTRSRGSVQYRPLRRAQSRQAQKLPAPAHPASRASQAAALQCSTGFETP